MDKEKASGENTIYAEMNYLWEALSSAQEESVSVKKNYELSLKDIHHLKTRISHLENILKEKSDLEKELRKEIVRLKEKIDSDSKMVQEAKEISLKLAEVTDIMRRDKEKLLIKDKTEKLLETKILEIERELENSKRALNLKDELIEELQLKMKGILSIPEISATIEKELKEDGKEKRNLLENLLCKLEKEKKLNHQLNTSLSELNKQINELKNKNQSYLEENEALLLEVKDRETKIKLLERNLNTETLKSDIYHQQTLQLQGEINSMNLKIEELKKEISESLQDNEKLRKILLEKDEKIKEITNKIKDSELKIDAEKQNFADAVKKIFSLQSKLSELRESLKESHQENKNLAQSIEEKNRDLEKISLKFKQEHDINRHSLNKISAMQSQIEKMKEVIAKELEYNKELAKKLKDKEEHIDLLKKELNKIDILQIEVEELKKRNRKITSIVQQEQFEFIEKISKSLAKISGDLRSIGLRIPLVLRQNLTLSDKSLSNVIGLLKTYQEYLDERPIETHPENIRNILEQLLGQWDKAFRMKRLFIKPKFETDIPYCKVNPEKVKTAFNQIIKNSLEAMPAGRTLTIDVKSDAERKFVYVKFEDNGPGFTPQSLENMFIPFFTTKKDHIGIGLCIARKIAEKLNGELSISNKNEGGKVTGVVVEFKFPASYEKDMPQ